MSDRGCGDRHGVGAGDGECGRCERNGVTAGVAGCRGYAGGVRVLACNIMRY